MNNHIFEAVRSQDVEVDGRRFVLRLKGNAEVESGVCTSKCQGIRKSKVLKYTPDDFIFTAE